MDLHSIRCNIAVKVYNSVRGTYRQLSFTDTTVKGYLGPPKTFMSTYARYVLAIKQCSVAFYESPRLVFWRNAGSYPVVETWVWVLGHRLRLWVGGA